LLVSDEGVGLLQQRASRRRRNGQRRFSCAKARNKGALETPKTQDSANDLTSRDTDFNDNNPRREVFACFREDILSF
jgi:hypothetical protein